MFVDVKYLNTASFPVLKMRSTDALGAIKVDVTFQDHNGERCLHLMMEYGRRYGAMQPLTLVMKQVLYLSGLNDPYVVG